MLVVVVLIGIFGPRLHGALSLLESGDQIDVGGRNLFVRCVGSGQPTVVLEHGLGSNGHEWQSVQNLLSGARRVCFTSRAGMGFSDAAPEHVRTAQDAVDDLAEALKGAGLEGPYVLVGHSFGGLVVRLFAAQQPDDVVGVVLVDSAHEDQVTVLRRALSSQGWAAIEPFFRAGNPERMDFEASADQLKIAGGLGEIPLEVLEAGQQETPAAGAGISPSIAVEIDGVMRTHWPRLQADLASLSSNGHRRVVGASGHFIQIDQPEAVVDAVDEVLRG